MFQPVTEENVLQILQSLNSNKATGLDKVPPRFLKDGAKFITALLTYIIYQFHRVKSLLNLNQPKLPLSARKKIKLKPVTTGLFQYLVLLVNYLRKLFMTNWISISQITKYYTSISQVSCPPTPRTDTCLIHLTDYIKSEQDKGNLIDLTGMVFLDLQKTFYAVNHNILLGQLQASPRYSGICFKMVQILSGE